MADKSRLADIKVGAFVLAALSILVVGSLWIAGSTLFGARRVSYTVVMKDSAGLQAGDRVRLAGVSVGRIQGVTLRHGEEFPVALQIAIRSSVPVRSDTTARITTAGLLGANYLQLEPGSPDAPLLSPGGEIRGRARPGVEEALARLDEISVKVAGLLDQTSDVVDQISGELGPIMSNMEALLSEENAENIQRVLSTLRETADDAAPRLKSLLARLESISEQVEGGVEGLPELTTKVSSLIDDVKVAFGPDGSRLERLLETAESSLGSAGEALSILGGNRKEIEAAVRDLRDTMSNLKAFSQHVKERPFSLVRIKGEPERQPGEGVRPSSQ